MFAPFSSGFFERNGPKTFSFREIFQFPPAGGPRIRKLKIFGETEKTRKTGKTEKTEKTEKICSIFVWFPNKETGRKIASFASFSSFASFRENCEFPDSRAAGRRKLNVETIVEMIDTLFGNWTFLEIVKIEIRNGCEKSLNFK